MDFLQSHHTTRKHPQKTSKKRLTHEQVRLLETSFNFNNKLDSTRKVQLAQELDVPPRQIAIWYQNKRARWRNQSLENDYKALQLRLDHLLEDKNRLEKEVEKLKGELDKAKKDMLVISSSNTKTMMVTYNSLPSFSSSCDEVGSSSLLGNNESSKYDLDHGDLYACFADGIVGHDHFDRSNGHDFFAR